MKYPSMTSSDIISGILPAEFHGATYDLHVTHGLAQHSAAAAPSLCALSPNAFSSPPQTPTLWVDEQEAPNGNIDDS